MVSTGLRIQESIINKGESVKPNARRLLLFCFLVVGTPAGAAETDSGKQLYMQYCSSCHGINGRGNGPVTPYLKIKVPDLTLLKKNNRGIYPLSKVMSAIDGSRAVRAHGDREMPVWGEIFRKEAEDAKYSELTALLKGKLIAEYVATLQR
jgi:mono/diheme cytochrome c family protein